VRALGLLQTGTQKHGLRVFVTHSLSRALSGPVEDNRAGDGLIVGLNIGATNTEVSCITAADRLLTAGGEFESNVPTTMKLSARAMNLIHGEVHASVLSSSIPGPTRSYSTGATPNDSHINLDVAGRVQRSVLQRMLRELVEGEGVCHFSAPVHDLDHYQGHNLLRLWKPLLAGQVCEWRVAA
jgi:hypothetical protein